jgi:hypothetical protein
MAFKCVPLNPAWAADSKLDMHAIYKRPNGDLMTLPLRRHHQWEAKGFAYVTLADAESFKIAVPFVRSMGMDPQSFICGIDGDGRQTCWNAAAYTADQKAHQAVADAELQALVAEHGVEAVERIRGVKVPEHLKPAVAEKQAAKREKAIA